MNGSRTAFTMIELVFVIVVLGILAAVAIPKLMATRDDAKISVKAQNIMSGVSEIAAYATSRGETLNDLTSMSSSMDSLSKSGDAVFSNKKAVIKAGDVNDCITLRIITGATDDNLTITFGSAGNDQNCKTLQSLIDKSKYPMKLRGKYVVY